MPSGVYALDIDGVFASWINRDLFPNWEEFLGSTVFRPVSYTDLGRQVANCLSRGTGRVLQLVRSGKRKLAAHSSYTSYGASDEIDGSMGAAYSWAAIQMRA